MIQILEKYTNASDSFRKLTQHHIALKHLLIQTVINKVTTANKSLVNQVIPYKITGQQYKKKEEFTTMNKIIEEIKNEEDELTNSDDYD